MKYSPSDAPDLVGMSLALIIAEMGGRITLSKRRVDGMDGNGKQMYLEEKNGKVILTLE